MREESPALLDEDDAGRSVDRLAFEADGVRPARQARAVHLHGLVPARLGVAAEERGHLAAERVVERERDVLGLGHLEAHRRRGAEGLVPPVEVEVVNLAGCQDVYKAEGLRVDDTEICAGRQGTGRDSCYGDSGGPLVVPNADGTGYKLAGIVSWGYGCADRRYPGLYGRVSSFATWIQDTVGVVDPGPDPDPEPEPEPSPDDCVVCDPPDTTPPEEPAPEVLQIGDITIDVAGDGFLYNMVRAIVGTLIEVGRGTRDADWLAEVLAARDRRQAGQTAPPHGLFLISVDYS